MDVIVVNKLDPKFKYEVASQPGGESFKRCFSCGTCTASCPVAEIDEQYNPRRIIRQILLGMRKEVLSSKMIWLCAMCRTCQAYCPQNVNFPDVMAVLRDMAVKEGYVPPTTIKEIEDIDSFAQTVRHEMVDYFFEDREKFEELKNVITEKLDSLKSA